MGKKEDWQRLREAAAAKVNDPELRAKASRATGSALVGASSALDGAEAVAKRSGLTNKRGEISKRKVVTAAFRPTKSARLLLGSATAEIQDRRGSSSAEATSTDDGEKSGQPGT